jgi:hypothetical protein
MDARRAFLDDVETLVVRQPNRVRPSDTTVGD